MWIVAAPEVNGEGMAIWPSASGRSRSVHEVGTKGADVL